jgi:tryptophan 2,3-dioxygenase
MPYTPQSRGLTIASGMLRAMNKSRDRMLAVSLKQQELDMKKEKMDVELKKAKLDLGLMEEYLRDTDPRLVQAQKNYSIMKDKTESDYDFAREVQNEEYDYNKQRYKTAEFILGQAGQQYAQETLGYTPEYKYNPFTGNREETQESKMRGAEYQKRRELQIEQEFREKNPTPQDRKISSELEEKENKQKQKEQLMLDSAEQTLSTIDEVEKGIRYFGKLGGVPNSALGIRIGTAERSNWESNVDTLTNKLVFNLITQMKEASKTGATSLGSLSDTEGKRLEAAATALRRDLSPEDAKRYLEQMRESANKILLRIKSSKDKNDIDYKTRYGLE